MFLVRYTKTGNPDLGKTLNVNSSNEVPDSVYRCCPALLVLSHTGPATILSTTQTQSPGSNKRIKLMRKCHISRIVPIAVVVCAALTTLSGLCFAADGVFDVHDYGAAGDGKKVDNAKQAKAPKQPDPSCSRMSKKSKLEMWTYPPPHRATRSNPNPPPDSHSRSNLGATRVFAY